MTKKFKKKDEINDTDTYQRNMDSQNLTDFN